MGSPLSSVSAAEVWKRCKWECVVVVGAVAGLLSSLPEKEGGGRVLYVFTIHPAWVWVGSPVCVCVVRAAMRFPTNKSCRRKGACVSSLLVPQADGRPHRLRRLPILDTALPKDFQRK